MAGLGWLWWTSLIVALAAYGFPLAAQQETGFLNRTVTIGGKPARYQVYVPFDYTPAKHWPVILFLHGAGERGTEMPQAPPESIWRGSIAEAAVTALEQSVKEFRGDRNRLYLAGLSMGGYGAWTLALKRPTMFAAIVAVCGGLLPPGHFTGLDVGLRDADPYAELARRLTPTPVWLFHGAEDSVVSPVESRRIHAAFHKAGSKASYTEYPGVGHNSWDPAFGDPMLWQWLFKQRRKEK